MIIIMMNGERGTESAVAGLRGCSRATRVRACCENTSCVQSRFDKPRRRDPRRWRVHGPVSTIHSPSTIIGTESFALT